MKPKDILLLEPYHSADNCEKFDPAHLINKNAAFPVDFMTYAAGLIYLKTGFLATKFYSIPLGLAQISAILKDLGVNTTHEPFILDAVKRPLSDLEIEQRIRAHDYDEVWMSIGSQNEAMECIRYARIIKAIDETTPVMLGGIFPTFYPEWFMKHEEIDMIIRGPAEESVRQYIINHDGKRTTVQGYCYKNKGNTHISPESAQTPDQSILPPMDYEGLCLDVYMKDNPFANLLTSRGCPFACPFCLHSIYWGRSVQYRKMENLRKELRTLQDHGCKVGYIVDSAFTLNEKHVQRFVDVFDEEKITIKFAFETRADHFNYSMAALCAKIHPALVWFGGESGSLTILSQLQGKQKGNGKDHLENMRKSVKNAKAVNIMSGSSWVIGLPGETRKTVGETKAFILELMNSGMDIADVRNLQLFPGTEYYNNAEKWGLLIEGGSLPLKEGYWNESVSHRTLAMSANDIKESTKQIMDLILEFYKTTSDFRKVMRIINTVQFMARHRMVAKAFNRLFNKS